jgi:hypothetical protein
VRSALVTALTACAGSRERQGVRDFLLGLSWDELEYIAEFVGSTILESAGLCPVNREQLAGRIAEFDHGRTARPAISPDSDRYHKMIVLMEFLCRTGRGEGPLAMRAG